MTRPKFVQGIQASAPRGRESTVKRRVLVASLTATLVALSVQVSKATESQPIPIAVFDLELKDESAGGGIIEADAIDAENLRKSTEEARRILSESNVFSVVDTSSVANEVISAGGVQNCNGCDGPLAQKLGADQSFVELITRVTRTEYTIQIIVRDAETGAVLYNGFTGLRMGANYSWPRGVKSLMTRMLSERPPG